jgi:hypothetical protein
VPAVKATKASAETNRFIGLPTEGLSNSGSSAHTQRLSKLVISAAAVKCENMNNSSGLLRVWPSRTFRFNLHVIPADPAGTRPGLRLDERAEWQVIGRPYTTAGGKMAHVRVESVKQPGVTDILTWGAHERISVKRATAAEGER